MSPNFVEELRLRELLTLNNQLPHQRAQLRDGRFLDFQKAFVLGQVPLLVRRIEHASARRRPVQGVRQALKHGEAIFASVTMPA